MQVGSDGTRGAVRIVRACLNAALRRSLVDERVAATVLQFYGSALAFAPPRLRRWSESLTSRGTARSMSILARSSYSTPVGRPLAIGDPLIATVELTTLCDRACPTCYSDSGPSGAAHHMSLGTLAKISKTRIPHLLLTGGEPTLHPDIAGVVELLIAAGHGVTLASHVQTRGFAEVTRKFGSALAVLLPWYASETTVAGTRGSNAWRELRDSVVAAASNSARIYLNLQLTDATAVDIEALVDVVRRNNISKVYVTRVVRTGRVASPEADPPPMEASIFAHIACQVSDAVSRSTRAIVVRNIPSVNACIRILRSAGPWAGAADAVGDGLDLPSLNRAATGDPCPVAESFCC